VNPAIKLEPATHSDFMDVNIEWYTNPDLVSFDKIIAEYDLVPK